LDTVKIGAFIAALRKEKNLTQEALGERLGVTNKTVSRWETGTYLPPVEALKELSELFDVTINELLSGRRLESSEYAAAAEENLKSAVAHSGFTLEEKTEYFKMKWLKEHLALLIFIGVCSNAGLCAGFFAHNPIVIAATVIAGIVLYGILNNKMMTYVEARAFD
jgi:transcriptional regulator with XRE-family HTH domain